RDPGHERTWITLAGGDIYQLGLIQGQAAARGVTPVILAGFIHVLEYLWKAAWCFHAPASRPWRTG
ncbi:MAG TPA: ISKra4 family transposase, partial [bacterium]|nr:ISKra4 family transposase [bacterium]